MTTHTTPQKQLAPLWYELASGSLFGSVGRCEICDAAWGPFRFDRSTAYALAEHSVRAHNNTLIPRVEHERDRLGVRGNGERLAVWAIPTQCTVPGCYSYQHADGKCGAHQTRVAKSPKPAEPPKGERLCDIEGCGTAHSSRGLCEHHYGPYKRRMDKAKARQRAINYPTPDPVTPPKPTPEPAAKPKRHCAAEGCERPARTKGYCAAHYARRKRGQDLSAPIGDLRQRRDRAQRPCTVEGCERQSYALGYCNTHWQRHRKGADLTTPIRSRRAAA